MESMETHSAAGKENESCCFPQRWSAVERRGAPASEEPGTQQSNGHERDMIGLVSVKSEDAATGFGRSSVGSAGL